MRCIALQCVAMRCVAERCIALRCGALHCLCCVGLYVLACLFMCLCCGYGCLSVFMSLSSGLLRIKPRRVVPSHSIAPRQDKQMAKVSKALNIKMKCAYKHCHSGKSVKGVGDKLQAKRDMVDLSMTRTLRSHASTIRFCCIAHKSFCMLREQKGLVKKRGQREVLNSNQISYLFHMMIKNDQPWVAVAMLFQVVCGERADAIRQAQVGWLEGILDISDPGKPAGLRIPKVNKKTLPRLVSWSKTHGSLGIWLDA